MIDDFVVRSEFPIFDETLLKMKRFQIYKHLSNKFQHIYCRSIEPSLNRTALFEVKSTVRV